MGYTHEELPVQEGPERTLGLPAPKFLDVWKIPDCGERTVEILVSLKRLLGFVTEEREYIYTAVHVHVNTQQWHIHYRSDARYNTHAF